MSDLEPEQEQGQGVGSYRETPYCDASWEIVGDPPGEEEFVPLEVPTLGAGGVTTDPMFEDFGGCDSGAATARWHLPQGVGYKSANEESAEESDTVAFTEEELEILRKKAFEEGLEQGRAEAREEDQAERQQLEESLHAMIADLKQQFDENTEQLQKRSVELALQIARKIIEEAVEINPEYIVEIIQEAISLSGAATIKAIRVSPADLEFIEVVGLARELKEADGTWEFVGDNSIKAGCIVETSAGQIDFQLDQAWERIRERVVRIIR